MHRRAFITGLLATPLVVRASVLDYVPRGLVMPKSAAIIRPDFIPIRYDLAALLWPDVLEWFGPDSDVAKGSGVPMHDS